MLFFITSVVITVIMTCSIVDVIMIMIRLRHSFFFILRKTVAVVIVNKTDGRRRKGMRGRRRGLRS